MVEPKPSPFLIVEDDKSITPQWRKSLKRIPEKIRSLHNLPNLVSSIATAPALKGPSGGGGRNRGRWSKSTNDSRVWDPNCAGLKFVTTRLRSGVGERLFCSMRAWIWLLTRFRTCYWIDQSHVMTSTLWERVCAPRKCGQCTLFLPKKKTLSQDVDLVQLLNTHQRGSRQWGCTYHGDRHIGPCNMMVAHERLNSYLTRIKKTSTHWGF